ncbi:hypothetical protein QQF64_024144 [Cirrhinus molitorella]|uniref:Uncharacterized protein n=1 Tax=Cirrhinus molitorella TaxID=172907 RepID=A0ABR3NL02_9TELE
MAKRFTLRSSSGSGHFHIQPDESFISLNAPLEFPVVAGERVIRPVLLLSRSGVGAVSGYLLKQRGVQGKVTASAWSLRPSSELQGRASAPHAHGARGRWSLQDGALMRAERSPAGGVTALILSDP